MAMPTIPSLTSTLPSRGCPWCRGRRATSLLLWVRHSSRLPEKRASKGEHTGMPIRFLVVAGLVPSLAFSESHYSSIPICEGVVLDEVASAKACYSSWH